MRIFNKEKTKELSSYDSSLGYLKNDILQINKPEIKEVKEEGHYEVIQEYENGGQDVKWVIDKQGVPFSPAISEEEKILIYIPFTKDEITWMSKKNELYDNRSYLFSTDYIIIKMSEKKTMNIDISEDLVKYDEVITKREECRNKINILEKECSSLVISDYVKEHY